MLNYRLSKAHMACAQIYKELSYAQRKVGAVLVSKDNSRILACGYNGTVSGTNNNCEDEAGNTLAEVVHAEQNIVAFCAANGIVTNETILYTTMSPCIKCATLLASAGISLVIYDEQYHTPAPSHFIQQINFKELQ